MTFTGRTLTLAGALLALSLLSGCGGSGSPAAASTPAPSPAPITGVSTPSTVAVVTATNAS